MMQLFGFDPYLFLPFYFISQEAGNFDRVFVNADLKSCFEDMVLVFKEWYPHLVEMAPDDEQKNCTSCVVS